MSETTVEKIREAVGQYPDPETGRSMSSMGQIGEITVAENQISLNIAMTSHSSPLQADIREALTAKVQAIAPGSNVEIQFNDHPRPPKRAGQIALRARSVIAVGSGKGGVGKSTVATSLALSLRQMGCKVGLMDADVYGPSVPQLLGLEGRPAISADKKIEPIKLEQPSDQHPMPVMSMGFLVEPDQAVIWRGPMLHGSINQFLRDTDWGELDYLIIDMPPGTGDVALTLSQAIPLAGAVVVCTPQEVALLDAIKAISMFRKVNIPVLGMVENMSGFRCPDCDKIYDIFGRGGARKKAEELNVPFLGELPIEVPLRKAGDEGRLAEAISQESATRSAIDNVAVKLVKTLATNVAANPPKPSLPTL